MKNKSTHGEIIVTIVTWPLAQFHGADALEQPVRRIFPKNSRRCS